MFLSSKLTDHSQPIIGTISNTQANTHGSAYYGSNSNTHYNASAYDAAMKLQEARKYAELELKKLEPFIVRGEIAGSIRRLKPDVKDIELVVIPKTDLFDLARLPEGIFHYETIKNGEKYKQFRIFDDFNLV